MLLGDEVLATALLDRLLHHAEVIAIAGRSYRMKDRAVPELPVPGSESRQSLARKERVGQFSIGDDTSRPTADKN